MRSFALPRQSTRHDDAYLLDVGTALAAVIVGLEGVTMTFLKREREKGLQEFVWKGRSPGDTGGVEIKTAEVKVDGVAESLAVAEPAR